MSTPAYGTPDNGWDTGRISAERIHDAARAEAAAQVDDAVDVAVTRVVAWINENSRIKLTSAQVTKMCKELEIGAHRAPASRTRG
jgi:hypothetical protein